MHAEHEIAYLRRRIAEERARTVSAAEPGPRAAHRQLAELYAARLRELAPAPRAPQPA